ncbi:MULTISPECIES: hypothetical protein [Limnohabitans]|jgi:hypothetical protein|nr:MULTISPECIES: hypothetical protein [Limnohabitans]
MAVSGWLRSFEPLHPEDGELGKAKIPLPFANDRLASEVNV